MDRSGVVDVVRVRCFVPFAAQGKAFMLFNLKRVLVCVVLAAACLTAAPARAAFHRWVFAEAFTSVDGTVQFIRMHCPAIAGGEIFLAGQTITCSNVGSTMTHTFTFPSNLSGNTSDRDLLIATSAFASAQGGFAPDFIIPAGFLFQAGGTLNFSNFNIWSYGALPTDGQNSLRRDGSEGVNEPRTFTTNMSGSVLVPPGACCIGAACSATIQISCTGTWAQGGSCTPNPCAPATAACCAAAGTCSITSVGSCSGTAQAPGSVCGPNPCTQPNIACCWASGACTTSTAQVCTTGGGVPMAFPSTCAVNPCPQPSGACCSGATCRVSTAANCTGPNTVFNGAPGCNAPGNNLSPCCLANHDHVAGIAVGDIFAFLGDWFAGSLRADFVGNGTATPQVSSIFGFLTAWFAGGC